MGIDLGLLDTAYKSTNPTRKWLHCSRRDWVFSALHRAAAGGVVRGLEVGPGSGVYLPVLARLAQRVDVMDIDQAILSRAADLAKIHPNLFPTYGDLLGEMPWPADHFDLILCSEVVEHLPHSAHAIAEIGRVLKRGGQLVITTPHRWSILETVARVALSPLMLPVTGMIYREPVSDIGHINLLNRSELLRQIKAAGLSVIEQYSLGLYLPVVAEAGGESGLRFAQQMEERVRNTRLEPLLWTQCYITRKN